MNWFRQNQRTSAVVAATLLVPLLLVLYGVASLLLVRHDNQVQIDRLEPRIARLKGLLESEPALQASVGDVSRKLENAVYPSTSARPNVSAELQNSVRSLLVSSGLSVSNIQALPIIEGEEFDQVGIRLTVRGELPEMDSALGSLEAHTPRVFVESMDMRPMSSTRRGRKAKDQDITATLRLVALRANQ
ncbi:MAG: type II secretion system protein GspM [Halieaceae bacterium]